MHILNQKGPRGKEIKAIPCQNKLKQINCLLSLPICKLMNYCLKSLALCTARFSTKTEISDVQLTHMENAWDDKLVLLL